MRPASTGVRALAKMASLGPASARMLAEAGVATPEELREIGPVEAFRRLRFTFGKRATASYLYALEVAVRGTSWRDLGAERMAELRDVAHAIAVQQTALISKPARGRRKP